MFAGASINPLRINNAQMTYLRERHFAIALSMAASIHFLFLLGWMLVPRDPVVEIPVRTLNIKLGAQEEIVDIDASIKQQPLQDNSKPLENTLNQALDKSSPVAAKPESLLGALNDAVKASRDAAKEAEIVDNVSKSTVAESKKKEKEKPKALKQDKAKKVEPKEKKITFNSNEQRQYVRKNEFNYAPIAQQAETPAASPLGNSTETQAEILKRYEQLVSLWIKKFQEYPIEARAQKLEGIAVMRIRIDRRGNIRLMTLYRSSGHAILDQAAREMIIKANPVPPVPDDYKAGNLFEFQIPVNFSLDS